MKNVYEQLKQEYRDKLDVSSAKYSSAKRLKYVLLSTDWWSSLTIGEIKDLLTYWDQTSAQVSAYDFMYGDKFITNE